MSKNTDKKKSKTLQSPPKECSEGEYTDLLATAASLTETEAKSELIECARYGELDAVRALLEVWSLKLPDYVNTTESNGSTALHKSGASGHVATAQLLLFNKAKHLPNTSGKNTPLHWASANGHEAVG
jgi:ankyrin repeat protein